MSSSSQHNLKQPTSHKVLNQRPREQPKERPEAAKIATNKLTNGTEPPTQGKVRMPAGHSSPNPAPASSKQPSSAASTSQKKNHIVLKYKAPDPLVLYRELDQNYPKEKWFDCYDSLDNKLKKLRGKSENTKEILLASLPILVGTRAGVEHSAGLQGAVRDTISYLLDIEAELNPVTAISSQPEGCSSALWKGRLWLGGIKDSVNEDGVLAKHNISAVVSIHPEDWLAGDRWKQLFAQWDGQPRSLKPGWTGNKKRGQYLIKLEDNSSSDLLAYFDKAFVFMDYYLKQGGNVLVHCKMGQSRSASLVLGYMMTKYYKRCMAGEAPPSAKKASKDLVDLKIMLKRFRDEISMPSGEPNKDTPRTEVSKRRGVNTDKFEGQLLQHLQRLSSTGQGGQPAATSLPAQQDNPGGNKAGGGIIKDAILVLCFLHDLKPTREVMGYWSSRKRTSTHYWVEASREKAKMKGIPGKDHLPSFNEFFESHNKQ